MANKPTQTVRAAATVPPIAGDKPVAPKLPALPKLPKAARKPKPLHACSCGCGGTTFGKFCPGHDSRLHGWVLRVEKAVVKLADIPDGQRQAVEAALKAKGSKAA